MPRSRCAAVGAPGKMGASTMSCVHEPAPPLPAPPAPTPLDDELTVATGAPPPLLLLVAAPPLLLLAAEPPPDPAALKEDEDPDEVRTFAPHAYVKQRSAGSIARDERRDMLGQLHDACRDRPGLPQLLFAEGPGS